jgi:FKBP-type peptidyl-prolyl cis-trans isomerase FkpA
MNFNTASNMRTLQIATVIIISLLLFSCGNKPKIDNTVQPEQYKNDLEKVNKTLVQKENEDIEDYIARHEWKMKQSGTGLRYLIYYQGKGERPKPTDKVIIRFTVNLINGVECYNSDKDGLKLIELGKAEVESGLEEGILLMKVGDKAKLIIPSHLAFGLLGDENKIPKRATLIYDVELVEIKQK